MLSKTLLPQSKPPSLSSFGSSTSSLEKPALAETESAASRLLRTPKGTKVESRICVALRV